VTGNSVADFWLLEVFIAVTSLTSLVVSAGFFDRQRLLVAERWAEERLRFSEERQRQNEQRRADAAEVARNKLRDFMGMVVHDLRGPLTVTLGYIQVLGRRTGRLEDQPNRETLGRIENALLMMNRLVSDLLDASRVGAGRFSIHSEETDLVRIVGQVVEEQKSVITGHRYVVTTPPQLIGRWDELRLRQVVTNLVANARTYSTAGTEIRIDVTRREEHALLSVADQGPGMAPDQIERLFQPFERIDATRRAGAGLGLYISRGIVDAHQGRIWVTSTVGKGSTFWVELPLGPRDRTNEYESGG
jgi:signal transduction histidine kinase